MSADVVIAGADLGVGRPQQIRVTLDPVSTIVAIDDRIATAGVEVVDAGGHAVLPAFTDHHLHLAAMARAGESVRCGPPDVVDRTQLARAIANTPPDADGWIRGTGYVETVAGDLDRSDLDTFEPHRPLRIQHRSGAMWMLNSVGVERVGVESGDHPGIERDATGRATGRLWRADAWLRSHLPQPRFPSLVDVGTRLRAYGIAEITDATPDLDDTAIAAITDAVDDSTLIGTVCLLGVPLGRTLDHPRISVGPFKIVIADSDLPSLDDLAERIAAAHHADRSVAVHCVSRVAFALLLAAWDIVGVRAGDRIEHAGIVPAEACADLARRGVIVVTQPAFLSDRGDDFLDGSEISDHADLYRCGSLINAGVPVALSSDAPYGPLSPWEAVGAAVERRTASGRVVGDDDERISVPDALSRHVTPANDPGGAPRRIAVGESSDLIIADRPLAEVLELPGDVRTFGSVIGGVVSIFR
uniref:amidohydrolase family protein n=1 Tax=Gordonia sp. B7-2 TaxID=3420932 RepID=UPI003D8DC4EC